MNRDPSFDAIAELAGLFEVSLTATARRFTEYTPEACAVVYSEKGYVKWFHGSREFDQLELFIDVRGDVHHDALADIFFRKHESIARRGRVKASAWFTGGDYRSNATILEHSIPMPSYDAVLSLLWIDDDISSDSDY